ncbi:MAG: sugar nucleotide-binding protein, partial [Burkholderiales bacterium]
MDAAALVVVGRSSLLARELVARHRDLVARVLGHAEALDEAAFAGARCLVNFAFAPALEAQPYDRALDIDLQIAERAARHGVHYIMISSRRVYARENQWNAAETAPAPGMDAYGRNKARVEAALRELLGERLTVLRAGNVFAYEPVAQRRRFGAYLQSQLVAQGRIRLSVDAEARRDLVPVEFFCEVVRAAALRRIAGVFNVGAGRATRVGDAARWLIEGYGRGELEVEVTQPGDEFQLDCTRLHETFGLACGARAVERAWR